MYPMEWGYNKKQRMSLTLSKKKISEGVRHHCIILNKMRLPQRLIKPEKFSLSGTLKAKCKLKNINEVRRHLRDITICSLASVYT